MQTHQEVVESTPTVATNRTQATAYDPYAGRRAMSVKLTQTIYFIFGLIEALLVIRFVLKALGASAEAGFAQFIYGVTGPLVAPFLGLFGTPQGASGGTLELHTLIAMVIYALVAWLLAKAAWLVFGERRTASVARTDTVETRVR
jgi:uncharacterized membrane protein